MPRLVSNSIWFPSYGLWEISLDSVIYQMGKVLLLISTPSYALNSVRTLRRVHRPCTVLGYRAGTDISQTSAAWRHCPPFSLHTVGTVGLCWS